VKDGAGNIVGYVETPTFAQMCQGRYCPWQESVVLRATEVTHQDRFTIRAPGCCDHMCKQECCETRCACVGAMCACGKFDMKISVFPGDMTKTDAVATIHWQGARECHPPFRVLPGYTFTVQPQPGVTYNDTCLLVLLAIYLDIVLVMKSVPLCGE